MKNKFRDMYMAKRSGRNMALDAGPATLTGEHDTSPAKQIEAAEAKAGVAPSGYAGIDAEAIVLPQSIRHAVVLKVIADIEAILAPLKDAFGEIAN